MTTIKDIANRLGIAVSTVSKGLNGANDISSDLRQLVLDTAIEMGYKTKKMKKEHNKKICVFIENMNYEESGEFGYEILLGFKQMAMRDLWKVDVIPANPTFQAKEKYDSFMLRNGYSGSFYMGFALQDDWMKQLNTTTFPTVLLDNYNEYNPLVGYIGTDSYEGIRLAFDHLYHLGHRSIAFLNGSPGSMMSTHRYEAFLSAMAEHQLEVNDHLIAFGYYVSECAKDHVPDFLANGATAILCASDLIAIGVIKECKKRGFRVPEDISVIGFDDLPSAATTNPPLTTIRQDKLDLGKSTYHTLLNLSNHVYVSKTLLRATLIERSSTEKFQPKYK